MTLDIQTIILFNGLLGLAWAYFLFTHKRGNLSANKFLAILIATLAILILRRTADPQEDGFFLYLYFVSHGFVFLIGPSIYFHIKNLTGKDSKFGDLWKHFTPAFVAIFIISILFIFRTQIDKIENYSLLKAYSIIFISLQVIHLLTYIIYSRKLVSSYSKKRATYSSALSRINLKWMQHLILITSIFGTAVLALHLLIVTGGYYQINNSADSLFLFLISVIVLSIIYSSWKQPEIVSGMFEEKGKYKKSPLTQVESEKLRGELENLMKREKTYLTPELNISQLAELIGTQSYLLSQLINEQYADNFFNFINAHRIDFAVDQIKKGRLNKTTLEAIAYESGFNSKSTFNRAFKKRIGCSPKDFNKSITKKGEV